MNTTPNTDRVRVYDTRNGYGTVVKHVNSTAATYNANGGRSRSGYFVVAWDDGHTSRVVTRNVVRISPKHPAFNKGR